MLMVATFAMVAPVAAAPMPVAAAQEADTSDELPVTLTVKFWGQAYITIDDETIKHYKVSGATLTATITNQFWWMLYVDDVSGSVVINGVEYDITEGKGISRWIFPVLECTGVDEDGNALEFVLQGIALPVQTD